VGRTTPEVNRCGIVAAVCRFQPCCFNLCAAIFLFRPADSSVRAMKDSGPTNLST
jgi:hypothetical protein